MFDKQSVFKRRDVAADKGSGALDLGPTVSTHPGTSVQMDNSITLWGPGVKVQGKTPSSILTQSLYDWRKDNAQLPAEKAAEELHNMYENLPPEALELTFQDMIGRSTSRKSTSDDNEGTRSKAPQPKSNAVNGRVLKESGPKVKDASKEKENGPKVFPKIAATLSPKEVDEENGPKVSLFAKMAAMLSSKEVHTPSQRAKLTKEDLDKLVDRRRRQAASSNRDGLYSASTTPASSFRRVSPITSPKLSPTPSFHQLMEQVDGHSFRNELSNSARLLDINLDDTGHLPPGQEGSHPRKELSHSIKRTTRGKHANDCLTCSTSNLFFLKATCQVCGAAFCPSCVNVETKEVHGGLRRCKTNCGELPTLQNRLEERDDVAGSGCWLIGLSSCIRGPVKRLR